MLRASLKPLGIPVDRLLESAGVAPTAARLRAVARRVQMELAIAMGVIVVAAVLVAQVPGRA